MDGEYRCNLVLANVRGVREPWAVITDEKPSLQTLWQYGLRFRVEELFLDSKSGAFQLEESKIRDRHALERLYLVVALAPNEKLDMPWTVLKKRMRPICRLTAYRTRTKQKNLFLVQIYLINR